MTTLYVPPSRLARARELCPGVNVHVDAQLGDGDWYFATPSLPPIRRAVIYSRPESRGYWWVEFTMDGAPTGETRSVCGGVDDARGLLPSGYFREWTTLDDNRTTREIWRLP